MRCEQEGKYRIKKTSKIYAENYLFRATAFESYISGTRHRSRGNQ